MEVGRYSLPPIWGNIIKKKVKGRKHIVTHNALYNIQRAELTAVTKSSYKLNLSYHASIGLKGLYE